MQDWERNTQRVLRGGRADPAALPKGESGRSLCRWCELEVPKGRRTFCSEFCVEQWKLRTDPSYLRERTFQRDGGVCGACGVDAVAAFIDLKRSRGTARFRKMQQWGLKTVNRKSLWEADHIIPVVEGGGTCDLSNIRTLCLVCHRKATADLRTRLVSSRVIT